MEITVATIGDRALQTLADARTGRVHSVFRHAVNLLLDQPGQAAPTHLTLLDADAHPCGLTCPTLPRHSLAMEDAPVSVDGGHLRIGAFTLPYASAEVWRQPAGLATTPALLHPVARALAAALQTTFAEKQQEDPKTWRLLYQRITDAFPGPAASGDKRGADAAPPPPAGDELCRRFATLIGFGPGLTPAGDDFASGYLACTALLAADETQHAQTQGLGQALAARDTTFFSQSQLLYAGQGLCLRSIFGFIAALAEGRLDRQLYDEILAIGATSGWAWLMGIQAAARGADIREV